MTDERHACCAVMKRQTARDGHKCDALPMSRAMIMALDCCWTDLYLQEIFSTSFAQVPRRQCNDCLGMDHPHWVHDLRAQPNRSNVVAGSRSKEANQERLRPRLMGTAQKASTTPLMMSAPPQPPKPTRQGSA
jgi:hypothetical protein